MTLTIREQMRLWLRCRLTNISFGTVFGSLSDYKGSRRHRLGTNDQGDGNRQEMIWELAMTVGPKRINEVYQGGKVEQHDM